MTDSKNRLTPSLFTLTLSHPTLRNGNLCY